MVIFFFKSSLFWNIHFQLQHNAKIFFFYKVHISLNSLYSVKLSISNTKWLKSTLFQDSNFQKIFLQQPWLFTYDYNSHKLLIVFFSFRTLSMLTTNLSRSDEREIDHSWPLCGATTAIAWIKDLLRLPGQQSNCWGYYYYLTGPPIAVLLPLVGKVSYR